ncbi:MAG: DNA repair protein RadC [Anaerolineales bacterium]|nr:DNA repair protein RadC [Anaerolineales bacterium]
MNTLFDLTKLSSSSSRRLIRDMAPSEQPLNRLYHVGTQAVSNAELIASVLQTKDALDLAHELLQMAGGSLLRLPHLTRAQLKRLSGIGDAQAARLQAALELGKRVLMAETGDKPTVTTPADAANLLMFEMMNLEQEHLRLILLDTRNRVLATPTVYIGSLNTSVVRIGELFKQALVYNAAALIVLHNHPSGDPSPSPQDVNVTRLLVKAGKLLDLEILDHIIIGRNRYVSLKERRLGWD